MGSKQFFIPASRQRGLALITAMLVVAIAATTAAYLAFDQQLWLRQSENLSDRAQADVVRAGAMEWAVTILAKDAKDSKSDDLTEDWAKDLPPLAVEGGQVVGKIRDAQGKFNINNLMREGKPSPPDIGAFRHLLESLDLNPDLTDAVLDWIDADSDTRAAGAEDVDYLILQTPYRTANQPLQSVEELRLVRGFFEIEIPPLSGRYQRSPEALIQRGAGDTGFRTLWLSQRLPYPPVEADKDSGENTEMAPNG